MQRDITIIGLSGTNGAGKDFVGELLADQYGYFFISVTDVLRAELKKRGLPPERQHMRALSAEWRREYGLGVLVDRAIELYKTQAGDFKGIVMASLRNPYEGDRIHELGGTLVWVDADPKLRYDRIQANAASRGNARAVDDQKTFEQFLAEEKIEMYGNGDAAGLDMASVKDRADITLINDTSDPNVLSADLQKALGLDSPT